MGRVELYEDGIEEMLHDPDGDVAAIIHRSNFLVTNEIKRRLLEPGHGRVYEPGEYWMRRGGKLYHWVRTLPTHQASAPGDSPASDTGHLLASIEQSLEEDANGVYGRVGSRLQKAEYLEMGTSLMAPRPFLRPALDVLKLERDL